MMVRDHRIETLQEVELSRPEIDEPGHGRGLATNDLHGGVIELLKERHVVGDVGSGEGLGRNRSPCDSVRVDVAIHADAVSGAKSLSDQVGLGFHRLQDERARTINVSKGSPIRTLTSAVAVLKCESG